jgi:putative MATE family efflux protein
MILLIAFPILIQNGITNFVNLLDNIMVGQLGTEQMSGVAIVNQLMTVFNLCIFGAVSGASIFSAQFYGQGNHEGVRNTFRFKLICCTLIAVIGIGIFWLGGDWLISMYLHDNGSGDVVATHEAGREYLMVMLFGMLPYAFTQIYSSTLRETGETIRPMIAGIVAVFVNLFFNYLLIFGKCGFPQLKITGAAVATVISRFVELGVVVVWTHMHSGRYIFIQGAYKTLYVPAKLVRQIIVKGMPLLVNETLWSAGQAILMQCYSTRGLDAVAAVNISSTVSNLFNVVFIALGSSISIVVGQLLGADELEKAVDTDRKMIFFSVTSCVLVGILLFGLAPVFPKIYNTTEAVQSLAAGLIRISALFMPLYAFYHASYFTLRTGGKTMITFLFDSCYVWAVNIPVAYLLSHYTALPLLQIYGLCQSVEIIKGMIGFILLKKGVWIHKIV